MTWGSPLQWPAGQPRTERECQLRLLGAENVIVSTNRKLSKATNRPLADQCQPEDRGVAVYFDWNGQELCFAVDRWDVVLDDIHANALSIAAIRDLERWGGEMVERSFQGFAALPATSSQLRSPLAGSAPRSATYES
jgi:hypothetical protein